MDKENASSVELPESGDIEIIGIRFRDAGKVYYFSRPASNLKRETLL